MATKESTLEVLSTTVKAILSTNAPGAAVVSVINDFQAKQMKAHFDELCDKLQEEIKYLDNKVDSHYEHPEYNDNIKEYIYTLVEKIVKERTETKRNAYRHILLNSSLTKMSDYELDIGDKVVKILDQLTATEIMVLYNLKDVFYNDFTSQTITKQIVYSVREKVHLDPIQFVSIAKSLEHNYLVENLSEHCIENVIIGNVSNSNKKFLTDLGEQLVKFILLDGKLDLP